MDVLDADKEEGFSFIWTIQNYNFCFRKNKDNFYVSPTFELHDKSGEKWCLSLYPERYFSHDSIGIAFQKCTGAKVTTVNSFGFGSSVTSAFGSPIVKRFWNPNHKKFMESQPQQGVGNPAATCFGGSKATTQSFGNSPTTKTQSFGIPATAQHFGIPTTAQCFGIPTTQSFGIPATTLSFGSPGTTQGSNFKIPNTGLFGNGPTQNVDAEQSHPKQLIITDETILEISICDVKGSFTIKFKDKLLFQSYPDKSDVSKLKIKKEELDSYLDKDSLTIKCRVWDSKNPIFTTRQCYARTIIDVEKITYVAAVEGFQDLESGESISKRYLIHSDAFPITIDVLSTTETFAENKLQIAIQLTEPRKPCYSICEVSLVGASGTLSHSTRHEYNFDSASHGQVWEFPIIEVGTLLHNKELFLSNGVLRLLCEFGFSSGVAYNKIERIDYARRVSNQSQGCNRTPDSLESLKDSFQRFFDEGRFSDLTIRTPTKDFHVHKTILCARSKYFCDMIQNDANGVLNLEDVSADSVSKMLQFFYTGTVGEDMKFGTASSLYSAADKYGIAALKRMGSDFLKDNFTATNVCDVLVLADKHQDDELKTSAQSFIFKHNVTESDEWKKFMDENVNLSSKVMHAMLKNSKI